MKSLLIAALFWLVSENYLLPEVEMLSYLENDEISEDTLRDLNIWAYPIVPTMITEVQLDGRDVLNLPIIVQDDDIPISYDAMLANPLEWGSSHDYEVFGRKSTWFMQKNEEMLYSVLIDVNRKGSFGLGFITIKRVGERDYIVFLRDLDDTLLYAAAGEMEVLDESIGMATFNSHDNQAYYLENYDLLWKGLSPEEFVLFN